jgi:PAS domain-containing protein
MREADPKSSVWKLLWDYDPKGLLMLDANLRIVLVNPALCRMFRSDAARSIGCPGATGASPRSARAMYNPCCFRTVPPSP